MHLTSRLLSQVPGLLHAFGTREEPVPSPFTPSWESLKPRWKQVHGTNCVEALGPGHDCGETDCVYTRRPGTPVAVVTADCVPILLAARDGSAVAAVHAGWRGTRGRILETLWARLRREGADPLDWIAAIGPAIGPCCYEVSEDLATEFAREFAGAGAGVAVPQHRRLDLPAINAFELRRLGVTEVDLMRECTRCSLTADGNPRYFSYRRMPDDGRQRSIIQISGQPDFTPDRTPDCLGNPGRLAIQNGLSRRSPSGWQDNALSSPPGSENRKASGLPELG